MPTAFRIAIIANVVLAVIVWLYAWLGGGGFTSGVFPPSGSIELQLVPIDRLQVRVRHPEDPGTRLDIPTEYATPDPVSRPWTYGTDGAARFPD